MCRKSNPAVKSKGPDHTSQCHARSAAGTYLAVRGADADRRCPVKDVDSSLVLLLSWSPDGHICQLVPIHISQNRQSCPEATPGMALLPVENGFTPPWSPLLNRNSDRPKTMAIPHLTPSHIWPIHPSLTPLGKGHTDTWPPRVCS